MSAGPPRPFVSVKFSPVGRTYTFLLPELALDDDESPQPGPGSTLARRSRCVVQTAEGPALGTVTRAVPALAARKRPPADSERSVVRRATRDDVVTRLKQQQREQEAQRICLMKIRERGLAMKLDARRAAVRRLAAHLLLHRRRPRRLPRAGPRPRGALPHAHRDAADRRPRRGEDARRLRIVRPSAVLHDVAADASSPSRSRWRSSRTSA